MNKVQQKRTENFSHVMSSLGCISADISGLLDQIQSQKFGADEIEKPREEFVQAKYALEELESFLDDQEDLDED